MTVPKGVINFDAFWCKVYRVDGYPKCFNILIEGIDRAFQFRAPDIPTCNKWIEALKMHIGESDGCR